MTRPGRLCLTLSFLTLLLTAGQLTDVRAANANPSHEPITPLGQPTHILPASDVASPTSIPPSIVRVGVLAYMGTARAEQEWAPVQQYLQTALSAHEVKFVYLDLDEMTDATAERAIDFVLTNPGHYITLELSVNASRIVTLEQSRHSVNGLSLGSAVIARADNEDLINLEDLPGHTLVATAHHGFGGYQTVWRELATLGIDPKSDLEAQTFVGFPMSRILDAVADGHADAGILRACVLEDIPDWRNRYKVLSPQPDTGFGCAVSTRLYPDWPLAALPHTSPELARDVAITLLQMPTTTDGRRFTVPADYQSVHELFRELQIGPYPYMKEQGVAALARRHWPVLALLGAVVLLWLLYTFRVEKLVHARTRALRETLEERKQIEARMRASQESVDHLSRLSILGELSTTLAHELSQPLAGIANYGRSLLRRLDGGRLDDDAVRLAATEITQQAQHAANVLSRIKAFARKRVSVREECRPVDAVSYAVSLFCGMLSETPQVHIVDHLSPDTRIRIDKSQIQQVLLNLMKNSMDAMREVEPDKRHIDITLAPQGTDIFIHVRDYGPGLSTAQQAQLFEPFYTDKPDGLGLGLSISYSIIEAHGGTLTASAPCDGKGMIFSLLLPTSVQNTDPPDHPIKPI